MILRRTAAVVALSTTAFTAQAATFGVDARSLGMGNVSVATANITTAALANPAMLAHQRNEDDFALLLPAVGIFIDDSDGMTDLIDNFQAAEANYNSAVTVPAQGAAAQEMYNALQAMNNKDVSPQFTGALALGASGETYSFALSARTDVLLAGGLTNVTTATPSAADFQNPAFVNNELLDPNKNQLLLNGVASTEIGVSLAANFDVMGRKIAVGVTPKVISIESITFQESVVTAGTDAGDLLDEDQINDLGSITTLDAGVVMGLTDSIQLGVVARNLLSDEVTDGANTIKFDTQLRAGISYRSDMFTLGVDMDLTENEAIVTPFGSTKSKLVAAGLEIDVFDTLQLRVGMQQNVASGVNEDALITAGVGLSLGFTIDLAVITGDDVVGGYLQTGFRF